MEIISADELKQRLKREKIVTVCGMNFRIKRVPLLFLEDEKNDFWALAREGKEALSKRIRELISNPKLPQFRRVLIYGIVEPKIGIGDGDNNAVPVDYLLSDYTLAVNIYLEIIKFTLDTISQEP